MRSMYGPEVLLLSSKKPRIQELISRSKTMTADEIRSLPEKPDVIRGLLVINQLSDGQKKATMVEKIASEMQKNHVSQPGASERSCQVFKVVSIGDGWLKTGSTLLEIKEGWNWAQLSDGTIYLTNFPIKIAEIDLKNLIDRSEHVGMMSFDEYKDLERNRRNSLSSSFILQLDQ